MEKAVFGSIFPVMKSDGRTTRIVYDARLQNRILSEAYGENIVRGLDLHLLTPFELSLVMLRPHVPAEVQLVAAEIDAKSAFPSLQWCREAALRHAVKVKTPGGRTRAYYHLAPAQGSTVIAAVCQTVMLAVARGPPMNADVQEFVAAKLAITYDNFLLVDTKKRLEQRVDPLEERMRDAGAVVGDKKGPSTRIEAVGHAFAYRLPGVKSVALMTRWAEQTASLFRGGLDDLSSQRMPTPVTSRVSLIRYFQKLSGKALWAIRVLQEPLSRRIT